MKHMPIEFRYDREKEILLAMVNTPLTLKDFEAAMKGITRSDQFPSDIRTLWDVRELDFSDIDRSFEERLIDIRKKFPARGSARNAVVVAHNHGFAMGRTYEALTDDLPLQFRVFKSFTEAEDWLIQP
jgi:hypothetical protein